MLIDDQNQESQSDEENKKHPCSKCPSFVKSFLCDLDLTEIKVLKEDAITMTFNKGQQIINANDAFQGVFCIRSGVVKLFIDSENADHITVALRNDGNLIGYHGVVNHSNIYSVQCMTKVVGCFIPKKQMLDLKQNSVALNKINTLLLQDVEEMVNQLTTSYSKSIGQRLAEAIVKLEDKFGLSEEGYINIPLTRKELAEMIGASIESVFRSLAMLKNKKWIDVNKQYIKILDRHKLTTFKSKLGS